jgi:Uncharacterized protein conserved in bacteria (DUF2330)
MSSATTRALPLCVTLSGLFLAASPAAADPCGMVPPIYSGQGRPIERVGAQKTYVFYRDGVESVAIRPGFRGKVDEFGMLIPFPSVPELRKLPDQLFPHVQAAIDPPEVVMHVYRHRRRPSMRRARSGGGAKSRAMEGLAYDQVRVLKQEAVGMYQVAVLAAGSAAALKRWMGQHGYRYPKGMDVPANDYVKLGWCFVAVKTKVGQKKGVNPRPGMRRVKSKLPAGSSFSGHVQAMGFRFRTRKLVVPMRLSAFNGGRMRNIVYVLTNGPQRINHIPSKYVVRQLPGWKLHRNLTRPLPLRVIGGTIKDLRPYQRQSLRQRRNPRPHNEHAAELFATDALAVRTRRLSHPHEELKKELLRIGERLKLRGANIDRLNREVLKKKSDRMVRKALGSIKQMTMTVVDGDFARDVVANENLTFARFRMPRGRNNPKTYDARQEGPNRSYNHNRGKLYRGSLEAIERQERHARQEGGGGGSAWGSAWAVLAASPLLLLGLTLFRRRRKRGGGGGLLSLLVVALIGAAGLTGAPRAAHAQDVQALVKQLGHRRTSQGAATKLKAMGQRAVPKLLSEAFDGTDPARRGWAIVCLAEIGGPAVDADLEKLHRNPNHPNLVRTWAAAARIQIARGTDKLVALSSLVNSFPALKRPLGLRLVSAFSGKRSTKDAEQMLLLTTRVRSLRQAMAPAIVSLGPKPLIKVMISSSNQQVRRQAAAYLGTIAAQQGADKVGQHVLRAYRFDGGAKRVPWDGGPLFVPGIKWSQGQARKLAGHLVTWHVWVDYNGKGAGLKKQLHNNLRSLSLARAAGYQSPGWSDVGTERWLQVWGGVVGRKGIEKLLSKLGWAARRKYRDVLEKL